MKEREQVLDDLESRLNATAKATLYTEKGDYLSNEEIYDAQPLPGVLIDTISS